MAKVAFTAPKVIGFTCPPEKKQAFLWDATAAGLGLRATPAGKPAFIFQAVYQGKDIRLTIGSPGTWTIPLAQEKARALQRMIDQGQDPRSLKADALAQSIAAAAQVEADKAQAVTTGEVWQDYIAERRPHWGAMHYLDHTRKVSPGGIPSKRGTRGKGVTSPGPLHSLMALPLRECSRYFWAGARNNKPMPH